MRDRASFSVLVVIAVGFGLRLHQLTFQPLWWDEGISLYLATQSFAQLTWAKDLDIDLHPPVYQLTLRLWVEFAGYSVFATRLWTAVGSTLGLPLVYVVARRWLGGVPAVIATALASVSPFLIYYGQEVRMYGLMPALALLSVALWQTVTANLDRGARPGWAGFSWVVTATLCLLTYYYLVWLVAAQMLLGCLGSQFGRRFGWWTALGGGIMAGFAPWILALRQATTNWWDNGLGQPPPPTWLDFVVVTWRALSHGFAVAPPITDFVAWFTLALAMIGLLAGPWRPGVERWRALALGLAGPLGSYLILAIRPFYFPRMVLPTELLLTVFLAAGVAAVARGRRTVALALVGTLVVGAGFVLNLQWSDRRAALGQADYLATLETIAPIVQSGDLVFCAQAWQCGYTLAYLAPRQLAVKSVEWDWLRDRDRLNAEVAANASRHRRVWVMAHDRDRQWRDLSVDAAVAAAGRHRVALIDQVGEMRVSMYVDASAASPLPLDPSAVARRLNAPQTDIAGPLGGQIRMVAVGVETQGEVARGGNVAVTVVWQSVGKPERDYTVFNQLVADHGGVVAQRDSPPLDNTAPTSTWTSDTVIVDRHTIRVPPNAPLGPTRLIIGLYDLNTGERLIAGGADHFVAAPIVVVAGERQ